jgi:hypothetical protein
MNHLQAAVANTGSQKSSPSAGTNSVESNQDKLAGIPGEPLRGKQRRIEQASK